MVWYRCFECRVTFLTFKETYAGKCPNCGAGNAWLQETNREPAAQPQGGGASDERGKEAA